MTGPKPLSASFRDPAGFVFRDADDKLYRQVTATGQSDYDLLMDSGLYQELVEAGLLIAHTEVPNTHQSAYKTLQPNLVPFITYPFEWSFSQLQDAALLTLDIQKRALARDLSLKDASAYNVQFVAGRPVFIDTLSFAAHQPGKPWQAYRQFCEHFLAPLALMAYTDTRLQQLLRVHLDGIPLDLAGKLLPARAQLRAGLAMHISWHARTQAAKANVHQVATTSISRQNLLAILDSLHRTVAKLKPKITKSEWGDYYSITNYTTTASDHKAKLVQAFAKPLHPATAVDLGGNNGRYSRLLSELGANTVCADIDPNAVEANYRRVRSTHESNLLPLLVDLVNPGGALGWQNHERAPVHERLRTDLVMALALIHHLAISNNLPLGLIAKYFKQFGPHLIIEFVPKSDSQVQKLLSTRRDIFANYHEQGFLKAFERHYDLLRQERIQGSDRTLYLFRAKGEAA